MMRRVRGSFVLSRMNSGRLVLGAVALTTVISAALAAALASFAGPALPQAAHAELASTRSAIAIQGDMGAARARGDTRVIRQTLRTAFGTAALTLHSAVWSDPLGLPAAGRNSSQIRLIEAAAADGIRARAALVAGTWPAGRAAFPGPAQPVPAAVPVAVANQLQLAPGDVLALHDTDTAAPVRIRVTGLFRPRDLASPYWRLNVLGASGSSVQGQFVTYGPLIVAPSAFGTRGASRAGGLAAGQASWVVVPDLGQVAAGQLGPLAGRITRVETLLRNSQSLGGLTVTTNLPSLLTGIASRLVVARSLMAISVLELLLLAGAALALAARLLATQRQEESALLSARGAARWQLARLNAAEAAALAAVAAGAGVLLAGPLARILARSGPLRDAGLRIPARPAAAWWAAAAVFVLCAAIMLWPAVHPVSPGSARQRRGRQAALAGAAAAGGDIALVGLALLAGWQLRRYSAVAPDASRHLGVDPVLTLAPALALAGGTVAALRLIPVLARAADRLADRRRRLSVALPSWQISRRPVRQSGPALLVVLAVATGTLALAQQQSWQRSVRDQADFTAGADARLDTGAPAQPGQSGLIGHAPGVLAAMPVARPGPAGAGQLLALDARKAASTVLLRPDLAAQPPAALWRRIIPAGPAPGLLLPGRPARLAIMARLGPPSLRLTAFQLTVSVQDASGVSYPLPAGNLAGDGRRHTLVVSLAAARRASYPLRLVSIAANYSAGHPDPSQPGSLTIQGVAASPAAAGPFPAAFADGSRLRGWLTRVPPADLIVPGEYLQPRLVGWRAAPAGAQALLFFPGYQKLASGLVPTVYGQLTMGIPARPVIPGIATTAYLAASHLRVGASVAAMAGPVSLQVKIVAAIAAFPTVTGAGGALIVDQAATADAMAATAAAPLPVSEWWLRTASPATPPGLPAGAVINRARLTAAALASPLAEAPQQALLAMALAAVLLGAVGFSVSVTASVQERRAQGALLSALGVSRAAQGRLLGLEQLMLSLPAAAAGLLLAAVLARLLIPAVTLSPTAGPAMPPVLVEFPLARAAVLAAVVALVPALAAAVTVARRPDPAAMLRTAEAVQ